MAHNIVIIDTLDDKLDPGTFRLLDGTPMTPEILWKDGNRLYIRLTGINLPDSSTDMAGSQGHITYAIKARTTAPEGSLVKNKASIYFDYNKPITTNETHNILRTLNGLDIKSNATPQTAVLYPNPTKGNINIAIPYSKTNWDITIIDISGRPVMQTTGLAPNISLYADIPVGLYIVQLTNSGTGERIVKKLVISSK
jgi:hypothetical protein